MFSDRPKKRGGHVFSLMPFVHSSHDEHIYLGVIEMSFTVCDLQL